MNLLKPLDDKIVLMGMSCVGKTTLGQKLKSEGRTLYHFDPQYNYKLAGMVGFSPRKNLKKIIQNCPADQFVLDNWSTEDKQGALLYEECPEACICVVFDTYPNILARYRCDVKGEDGFYMMYEKMYCKVPFEEYPRVRFLKVESEDYREFYLEEFREFIRTNLTKRTGMQFNTSTWTWEKNVPKL
jgi:hypothetical protein